jgi:hypothetical protein
MRHVRAATAGGRALLALPAELSDAALEGRLFTAVGTKHHRRAEPRLGRSPSRAEAQARHVADLVERVHRAATGRLPLFPPSRAGPRLGVTALGDDAAEPCRRRQAVCRLHRRHGCGDARPARQQDRRENRLLSPSWVPRTSPMLKELDAGARQLDRCAHQGLCRDRRHASASGAGQHESRRLRSTCGA